MEVFIAWTQKEDGDMSQKTNRINFLAKNNLDNKKDITIKQVHGNEIVIINSDTEKVTADGMITKDENLALFVRVADCVPILFQDTKRNVIGAVHAGREGTFRYISSRMIDMFVSEFNSSVIDLKVYIGPSIGVCCYEVSEEMALKVRKEYGDKFLIGRNINLQKINKYQILQKGILKENILISNECTQCNPKKYFSYRNTGKKENFAGIISLV